MTTYNSHNVLITGPARSGTTLTCNLLNKVPNSVALHEPMSPTELHRLGPSAALVEIRRFLTEQRNQILLKGTAKSKSANGKVPSNPLSDADKNGRRERALDGMEITVTNVNHEDFTLSIKHPGFFTGALSILSTQFSCFAIIRNPLAVLLSWRSAGMNVTNGRMPSAELSSPMLAQSLDAEVDVLERQLVLLDFCFSQYLQFLPGRTIKYEDIIESGGRALAPIHPEALQLDEPLVSRNLIGIRTDPAARVIAERLLEKDSACWSFYERCDVEALLR